MKLKMWIKTPKNVFILLIIYNLYFCVVLFSLIKKKLSKKQRFSGKKTIIIKKAQKVNKAASSWSNKKNGDFEISLILFLKGCSLTSVFNIKKKVKFFPLASFLLI